MQTQGPRRGRGWGASAPPPPPPPHFFGNFKELLRKRCFQPPHFQSSSAGPETTPLSVILDGSEESFLKMLAALELFGHLSGLRVNYEKTKALWISASRLNNKIKVKNKNNEWAGEKVKALGVWFALNVPSQVSTSNLPGTRGESETNYEQLDFSEKTGS